MLDSFISKLKIETEKLVIKQLEINNRNSIISTIDKLINNEPVNQNELFQLSNFINNEIILENTMKETIDFIIYIVPKSEKLDDLQLNALKELKENCIVVGYPDLEKTINRNKTIIEKIEKQEIFIYFDDLKSILKQYNYSLKDIYIIINTLIKRNFNVKEPIELDNEEIVDEINCEGLNTIETNNNEITESVLTIEEDIQEDIIENNEETLLINDVNYPLSTVINELLAGNERKQNEIDNFCKKYKISVRSLPHNYREILYRSNINIDELTLIFDKLVKYGISFKIISSEVIFKFILFAKIEYLTSIESKINNNIVRKIVKKDISTLYSTKNGGKYENVIDNYNYLKEVDPLYKIENYLILLEDKSTLETVYNYLKKYYRISTKIGLHIEAVIYDNFLAVLDRELECICREPLDAIHFSNVKLTSQRDILISIGAYILKLYFSRVKVTAFDEYDPTYLSCLSETIGEVEDYPFYQEETELKQMLDGFFIYNPELFKGKLLDKELAKKNCKNMLMIPIDLKINEELLENEYIDYLDKTYKIKNVYVINDTTVSRTKVLRVLSHLMNNNIDITEDVVLYALKFNYVFDEKDIENIKDVFKEKTGGPYGI